MKKLVSIASALVALTCSANLAHAVVITDLPGATASAGSCYLGCNGVYDPNNIIDGDYGGDGVPVGDSWNSGYWGGWVQIDFGAAYQLDRIELYGGNGYLNPYTLSTSLDGLNWISVASGAYHVESRLSQSPSLSYQGINYGAVHDVADNTLGGGVTGQYLRYTVNAGSPHWGYLYELRVDGHDVGGNNGGAVGVPEPATLSLMGLGLIGLYARRRKMVA